MRAIVILTRNYGKSRDSHDVCMCVIGDKRCVASTAKIFISVEETATGSSVKFRSREIACTMSSFNLRGTFA